jgi:hypothetical protein
VCQMQEVAVMLIIVASCSNGASKTIVTNEASTSVQNGTDVPEEPLNSVDAASRTTSPLNIELQRQLDAEAAFYEGPPCHLRPEPQTTRTFPGRPVLVSKMLKEVLQPGPKHDTHFAQMFAIRICGICSKYIPKTARLSDLLPLEFVPTMDTVGCLFIVTKDGVKHFGKLARRIPIDYDNSAAPKSTASPTRVLEMMFGLALYLTLLSRDQIDGPSAPTEDDGLMHSKPVMDAPRDSSRQ